MKKILFIEDESALQKTLGDILTREGYKVISALDGDTGLRLAKTKKPNLILLDIILPRMTGLELLRELKKDPEAKDIPVIILTNLEDMENIDNAIALGAKGYLVKTDYSLLELLQKIKKEIGD